MRRRLVPLLFVLAAVVGAACRGGSDADPTEVVAASAEKTLAAGSSGVSFSIVGEGADASTGLQAEGRYDYEKEQGTLSLDLSALGLVAQGPVDPNALPSKVEIVLTPKIFYMKIPEEALALADYPKPWVKIDLEAQAAEAGVTATGLEQLGGNDPTATLTLLGGAVDMEKVGEDKVQGVATTRYKGGIDPEKAVAEAPEDKRDELRATVESLGGLDRLPVEVWVDGEGRVRRILSTAEAGTGAKAAVTVEYFDFGVPVEVQIPPADQVADIKELREQSDRVAH